MKNVSVTEIVEDQENITNSLVDMYHKLRNISIEEKEKEIEGYLEVLKEIIEDLNKHEEVTIKKQKDEIDYKPYIEEKEIGKYKIERPKKVKLEAQGLKDTIKFVLPFALLGVVLLTILSLFYLVK